MDDRICIDFLHCNESVEMIVAFTGHRPSNPALGGYVTDGNPKYEACYNRIIEALHSLMPSKAISGMALGVDQWAALACIELDIPFIAAVPFKGQENIWPDESQRQYHEILKKAEEIKIVSEGGYLPMKLHERNRWMVDGADLIIAVWDGTEGGTGNCVKYATEKGKRIYRINPNNGFKPEWIE